MMLGEIQNPTDKDLLRAIAGATANDTFDILYVRWQKRIFRFYLRRLRHAEKSRDLSQIFWRRFCQKCHLYNGGSAKSFLYVMAKNILRDDYDSKENQRAKLSDSMDEGQEEDNEDGPGIQRKGSSRAVQHQTAAHDLIKKEYLELVEAALSQLLPKYARVLRLKYLAGLSSEEIAVRLGTTVGAVDVALTRARRTAKENQTLRNLFSGGGGGIESIRRIMWREHLARETHQWSDACKPYLLIRMLPPDRFIFAPAIAAFKKLQIGCKVIPTVTVCIGKRPMLQNMAGVALYM